jgi:hypothetical protein
MYARHQRPAMRIAQPGTGAPQCLGEQRQAVLAGQRKRGGMKLHELKVAQGHPCRLRQRQPAAIRVGRVAGLCKQPANTAGRQHHGTPMHRLTTAIGVDQADTANDTIANDQTIDLHPGQPLDVCSTPHRGNQGIHHPGTRGIATGMDDPGAAVAAFTPQPPPTCLIGIEWHPQGV